MDNADGDKPLFTIVFAHILTGKSPIPIEILGPSEIRTVLVQVRPALDLVPLKRPQFQPF